MKVVKITIHKDFIEVPNGSNDYREVEHMDLMSSMRRDNSIASLSPTFKEVRYAIRRVWQEGNPPIMYAVRINEQEIFDDMIEISNETFQEAIDKKTEELKRDAFYSRSNAARSAVEAIRNLPWHKRLFKKF